jgi:NAD(P)H-flavin reductase
LKNPLLPLKAVITGIKRETEDTKTYSLSIEDSSYTARPGQFNMVGYPGVGEAPVSLSSTVSEGNFQHTIRSVGRVTELVQARGCDVC